MKWSLHPSGKNKIPDASMYNFLHRACFVCILDGRICEGGYNLACGKCLFAFERKGAVEACPDCEHMNVRFATDGEVSEFERNRDVLRSDEK